MTSMFLTEDEVVELTGRTQRAAQKRVLNFMGIVCRERPDASLAILRLHVEESFGANAPKKTRRPEPQLNWEGVNSIPRRKP